MKHRSGKTAFSLIEVTLAIGIVSFALLAVVGLLPVALKTVKESSTDVSVSNILTQLRSELVQTPFTSLTNVFSPSVTFYYDDEGVKKPNSTDAYFQTTFAVGSPSVPGPSSTYSSNARNLNVTVIYPVGIPAAGQKTNRFSLLAARQTTTTP